MSLSAALLLTACGDSEITSYRVPKESVATTVPPKDAVHANASAATPPADSVHAGLSAAQAAGNAASAPSGAGMADTAVATAAGPGLSWSAPAHWQSKPASMMRKGSYAVNGAGGAAADLSITAFPGDVGGEFANVNRWRGQLQLAPLSEADAAASVTRLDVNGLQLALIDIANVSGPAPTRLLGAMVPYKGATWFFKLTGPDALVANEKPAFVEFLKTIQPTAPAAATP